MIGNVIQLSKKLAEMQKEWQKQMQKWACAHDFALREQTKKIEKSNSYLSPTAYKKIQALNKQVNQPKISLC